jgi:hypothetical protein
LISFSTSQYIFSDPYEITGQDLMEFILSNEDRNNGLDIPPPVHNARPQSNVDDGNRTNSQQTPQRNQSTPEPQVPSQGASGTSDSKGKCQRDACKSVKDYDIKVTLKMINLNVKIA